MERNQLALVGVLALAALATGIALYVAGPEEQASPVAGPATPQVRAKIILDSPIGAKGPLRALSPPRMESVVQLEQPPKGPPPKGSRLVVVTWDTVRSDHVSAYGYFRPTTPNFDALASEGLLFESFIVPQSTTLPTHVSLFTGVHPDEHGIAGNSAFGARRFVPPPSLVPLARHLFDQGYTTAGFVSSAPLKTYSGIAEGFQTWSQPRRKWRRAAETSRVAMDWLSRVPGDRPFFLWVHLYDPHAPYKIPTGYEKVFGEPSELAPWLEERGILEGREEATDRLSRNAHAYDTEIRYLDDQLKPLLDKLAERGFDDTVVVVAGDHGEGLGQHRHLEHGMVWPEQLAAPLAIRAPGLAPKRVPTLTTAQDLLPILAAVGEFPDEAGLLRSVSGRDVLADPDDRPILSRLSRRQIIDVNKVGRDPMQWSLRTSTHHFIFREGGDHALYDLLADPHAQHDLASSQPELVSELAAQVVALNARNAQRAAELGAGETEPLEDGTLEELKALGYMD